ncbi:MAG TPA: carboxypeptidase-like regulatory domain-containing protein, partial [Bryobacteraceae bacterium]
MQKIQTAVCIALSLFCSAIQVRAQVNATGTFSGLVTDPTGAAIGGAQVKVTNQGTGIVVTKQTAQ